METNPAQTDVIFSQHWGMNRRCLQQKLEGWACGIAVSEERSVTSCGQRELEQCLVLTQGAFVQPYNDGTITEREKKKTVQLLIRPFHISHHFIGTCWRLASRGTAASAETQSSVMRALFSENQYSDP